MALRPSTGKSREEQLAEKETAQQDVFLREVDDALREDELKGAFRRYGKPVGLALGAGLLALAGYLWWDSSQTTAAGKRGEQMTVALDSLAGGNLAQAETELKAIETGASAGTDAASRLTQAGIAIAKGDKADAIKLFAQVSADSAAPQPFRDLAVIREMAVSFDTIKPEQVISRLKPLAVPGNAWFGSAGELVGLAYIKQGRNDLAGPLFAAIAKDKTVPDTLRRRVRSMAGMLGVDAVDEGEIAAAAKAQASSQASAPSQTPAAPSTPAVPAQQ